MPVTLDHTIVHARNPEWTADFLVEILGLPPACRMAHFLVVQVGETSLDLIATEDEISSRHFAFRTSEQEFDDIFARLKAKGLAHLGRPVQEGTRPDQSLG